MPNYRRLYGTGLPVFLTCVTYNRRPLLIEHIHILKTAMNKIKKTFPFSLNAYVVLPDHFHLMISLPEADDDYSKRLRLIKTEFTKKLHLKNKIWQRGFWEHTIRDEYDYENHLHYIHFNPVKHRIVKRVSDWTYSSFHECVKRGLYDHNWGDMLDEDSFDIDVGE